MNKEKKIKDKIYKKLPLYETMEYDKFEFVPSNRKISTSKIRRIIYSIEKFGVLENKYVDITEDYQIVDGQHQFLAKKELGLPIIYSINTEEMLKVMIACNIQTNWKEIDFVNCYANYGNRNYQKIIELKMRYPDISNLRIYMNILTGMTYEGIGRGKSESVLRDGTLELEDDSLTKAIDICEKLMDYKFFKETTKGRNKTPWKHAPFYRTLLLLFQHENYNHRKVVDKIEMHKGKFSRRRTIEEYLFDITEIYNLNRKTQHKIFFSDMTR